jgi:hypothetical protein
MASHCAAGTGPIRPVWAVEPPAWLRRAAAGDTYSFLSLLDLGRGTFQIRPERVYGANLIIRRSVVIALGGFHPDGYPPELELMRGDGETGLMRKLAESGYTTMYAGDMGVGHVIPVKRMELSALRKRAYIGAISQSFHDLRAAAGLYKPSRIATENARIARIREKVGSRLPWNGGIALVLRTQAARKATPLWLQRELQSEAMRGYEAHQQRFHTDAEFRVHVLRDTWLEPEHLTSRG